MSRIESKQFAHPDEIRPFEDKGRAEILTFEGGTVGRAFFEPGWCWSKHVKPIAGTESCLAAHTCYVIAGRMHIAMSDGQTLDVGPGDVVTIPPGHDAWTIGEETCVMLDFSGIAQYALPQTRPLIREAPAVQPQLSH